MSDKNYYCLCDSNCKYPTMTKEQIIAAIQQAAKDGLVYDPDAAVVTKVKEQNSEQALTFWVGTQAQYNAIAKKDPYCNYLITDSTEKADTAAAIAAAAETAANAADTASALADFLSVSALRNGSLEDALAVDWYNPNADINKPQVVTTDAANIPEGYLGGVRVFYPARQLNEIGSVVLYGQTYDWDGTFAAAMWINTHNSGWWSGWEKIGGAMFHYSETEPESHKWSNGDIWLKPSEE